MTRMLDMNPLDVLKVLGTEPLPASPTALYKHKDANDNIIYVGIASNLTNRSVTHLHTADWQHEIASIDVEWCPNRLEAELREIRAIKTLRPKHNKRHNNHYSWQSAQSERVKSYVRYEGERISDALAEVDAATECIQEFDRLIEELEGKLSQALSPAKRGKYIKELKKLELERADMIEVEDVLYADDTIDALAIQRAILQTDEKVFLALYLTAGVQIPDVTIDV